MVSDRPLGHHHPSRAWARGDHGRPAGPPGATPVCRNPIANNSCAAGAYTVLRQVLEIGFFHADPHPGNLFRMEDGRLCFIDCGMAGRVDEQTTSELAMLIHGVATSDIDKVYAAFIALGNVDESKADIRQIRRDLQDFLDQFTGSASIRSTCPPCSWPSRKACARTRFSVRATSS